MKPDLTIGGLTKGAFNVIFMTLLSQIAFNYTNMYKMNVCLK